MPEMVDRVRMPGAVSVPSAADVVVAQVTRAIELGSFLPLGMPGIASAVGVEE